jgi:hypothetical protein
MFKRSPSCNWVGHKGKAEGKDKVKQFAELRKISAV